MEELTQFIVENQEFVWYFLAFIFFLYVAKEFVKIIVVTMDAKRGLKLTGKIK